LGQEPTSALDAIEAGGVPLLMDTGQRKPGENHPRPTDPALRSIAMTVDAYAALASVLSGRDTRDHHLEHEVNTPTPKPTTDALSTMPDGEFTEAVHTRVSPNLKQEIDAAAKANGRTTSSWIRRVLRQRIEIEEEVRTIGPEPGTFLGDR
jgi:hypothetical protein